MARSKKMKTLKKIDPMSAAKVGALTGLIWGLVLGILVAIVGLGMSDFLAYTSQTPFRGVGAVVFFPITYAISGFIGCYIFSVVYNFAAEKMGGVKVDLK